MVFKERPFYNPRVPIVFSPEAMQEIRRLCVRSAPVDLELLDEDEEQWEEFYLENDRNQVTLHVLPNGTLISLSQEIDNEKFSTQYDIAVQGGLVTYEHRNSHFHLDPKDEAIRHIFEGLPDEIEIESMWGLMEVEAQELTAVIELRFADGLRIQWSAQRMNPNEKMTMEVDFGKGSSFMNKVNEDERIILKQRQQYFHFGFSLNDEDRSGHPLMYFQVNNSDWTLEAKFKELNPRAAENLPSMFRHGADVQPVQLVPLTVDVRRK